MLQIGQTEAARANASANASAANVRASGDQKSQGYSKDAKIQGAVSKAVHGVAGDVVGKLLDNGRDIAQGAIKAAQEGAQKFRDAGRTLAESLVGSIAQVQQTLRQSTQQTVSGIAAAGAGQLQGLESLQAQAVAGLEKLGGGAIPAMQQAGLAAQARVRQEAQAGADQLTAAEADAQQKFAQGAGKIVGLLRQADGKGLPNPGAVAQMTQAASDQLRQIRGQIGSLLSEQATTVLANLGALETSFGAEIAGVEQKVQADAAQAAETVGGALSQAETAVASKITQLLATGREAAQKTVQQFGAGIQQQIDSAKQGWAGEKDKLGADIQGKVTTGLQSHGQVEQKAPPQFEAAAKSAASQAGGSIGSKLMAALSAVSEFAAGLVTMIAWGAVLFFAAPLLGLTGLGLGACIAIVAVCFLIAGLILAYVKRLEDLSKLYPDEPWYVNFGLGLLALGIAALDVMGLTGLYEAFTNRDFLTDKSLHLTDEERVKRGVLGFLTIFTLVIGAVKGLKGSDPIDPKSVDPVDPKGTDPVEPKGTDPVDPKGTDPANPNGINEGRPLETGAKDGAAPSPETIQDGSVRMEQHPDFPKVMEEIKNAGFETRKTTGDPHVVIRRVVDADGNTIRTEKFVALRDGMRFLDLEHELGHVRQMRDRFGGDPPPTEIVDENLKDAKNQDGVLTKAKNAIVEYHNRIVEFLRLHDRNVSQELIKEHAQGVRDWRADATKRGMTRSTTLKQFLADHFSDLSDLEKKYADAGGPALEK